MSGGTPMDRVRELIELAGTYIEDGAPITAAERLRTAAGILDQIAGREIPGPGTTMKNAGSDQRRMFGFGTAGSAAPAIPGAPEDDNGRQMAGYIARVVDTGTPFVVLGVVLGGTQMTVTMRPEETVLFSTAFDEAVTWQNEALRAKSGQAVH